MYDLIVVGGGPAGLTATIYAIRKRLNVLLITKDLGGKTNFRLALPWVEDYQVIKGLEIVNKFKSELEYLEFARHMEPADKIIRKDKGFIVKTRGGGDLETKAVIIATGTRQQLLNVPGEKEFIMRGLCYSALSYAPLFIDKSTVVIGDGDLAQRSTAELATVAKHVTLVCPADKLKVTNVNEKLKVAPNVTILEGHQVIEVKGDDYAKSLIVKDKTRQNQVSFRLMVPLLRWHWCPIHRSWLILSRWMNRSVSSLTADNHTSVPGIFAAGDVTNTYAEQVLVAVGEGAKATLSAYEYLLPLL